MKQIHKLPLLLIFLIAIAFSFKSFREPDLWWQIRTGEWILDHHKVPKQDVFSYTFAETRWINVKWGSEVVDALLSRVAGPESVFLLQALVICLLLFFLIKISRLYQSNEKNESRALTIALPISLLLTLIAAEYRINGRPEMFSHLFTVTFLFFLLRHRQKLSNKIFWLIPLQVLWANMHEAFGIGIVLTGIFCVGDWIEYILTKRKLLNRMPEMPKKLTLLLLGTIAAVIFNPNGLALLIKPLNILGQVYANKFTTELFDFRSPEYWQWNVFLAIALLVIGKAGWLLHFFSQKKEKAKITFIIEELGVGYLLTLLAFFYLASTAYRNVIFFVLVFYPILFTGLKFLLKRIRKTPTYSLLITLSLSVLLFALYALIVSNKYYQLTNSRDRFGLEVLSTFNPTGAADFIQQHHIKGRCFSDYLTSSYLLWKLQPEFKTFIDLRDLDIFPAEFFNTFAEAVTFPESFEKLDSTFHFDYVVLYRPQFASLHSFLFHDSIYHLRFVDAVAAVFQKGDTADSVPVEFSPCKSVPTSSFSAICNKALNPFYQPYNYSGINNDYLAATYYLQLGELDRAEEYALKAASNAVESYKGNEALGEVYYNKALRITSADERNKLLHTAGTYYQQSINEKNDFAAAHLGIGAIYFQQQNYKMALNSFEKCMVLDKSNLNAYIFATECCKYFINLNNAESKNYTEKAIHYYRKADRLNPDNPNILLNLGFLYYRLNDCDNSSAYLLRVENFDGLSDAEKKQVKDCLRQCGK